MNGGANDGYGDSPPAEYRPGALLNALRAQLALASDAALAKALGVEPVLVGRLRTCDTPLSGILLLSMHQVSGMTVARMRTLAGDRRRRLRMVATTPETGLQGQDRAPERCTLPAPRRS